jgi:hypothetical protein
MKNENPKSGYQVVVGKFMDCNCRWYPRRGYVQNRGDYRALYVPVASGGYRVAQIIY